MSDYFNSKDFQENFKLLIKSIVLISAKLEIVSEQLALIQQTLTKENVSDQLVTPHNL